MDSIGFLSADNHAELGEKNMKVKKLSCEPLKDDEIEMRFRKVKEVKDKEEQEKRMEEAKRAAEDKADASSMD